MATLVPLREAADLLKVSRQHVSRLVASGELHPRIAPCGCRLFDTDELLARRRNPPPRGPRPTQGNPRGTPTPELYMPEAEPVEREPDEPVRQVLVFVREPCEVTEGGQTVATLNPGPVRVSESVAQVLVADGLAVRLARSEENRGAFGEVEEAG